MRSNVGGYPVQSREVIGNVKGLGRCSHEPRQKEGSRHNRAQRLNPPQRVHAVTGLIVEEKEPVYKGASSGPSPRKPNLD